jgi:hypothetical protein
MIDYLIFYMIILHFLLRSHLLAVLLLLRRVVITTPTGLTHLLLSRSSHAPLTLLLDVANLNLLLSKHTRVKRLHQAVDAHLNLVRNVTSDQVQDTHGPRHDTNTKNNHVVHPAVSHLEPRLDKKTITSYGATHAAKGFQTEARNLRARLLKRSHRAHTTTAEVLLLIQEL